MRRFLCLTSSLVIGVALAIAIASIEHGHAQEPSASQDPFVERVEVARIQKDLQPLRAKGLLRWPQVNGPLFASSTGDDRVAVLSFDSHLRIWLDFTSDFERVRTVWRAMSCSRIPCGSRADPSRRSSRGCRRNRSARQGPSKTRCRHADGRVERVGEGRTPSAGTTREV